MSQRASPRYDRPFPRSRYIRYYCFTSWL
jgi:hypothetical protein